MCGGDGCDCGHCDDDYDETDVIVLLSLRESLYSGICPQCKSQNVIKQRRDMVRPLMYSELEFTCMDCKFSWGEAK